MTKIPFAITWLLHPVAAELTPPGRPAAIVHVETLMRAVVEDGSSRGEIHFIAGRTRALGGSIPIWMSIHLLDRQSSRDRGIPERYGKKAERVDPVPAVEMPKEGLTLKDLSRVEALEQRFNGATISVLTARESIDSLRSSLERRGLQLHPDTSRRYESMQASYERARTAMQERHWSIAEEQTEIASSYARRLIAETGR